MNLRKTAFNVLSSLRHRSVPAHIETLKRAEEDADFYRRTKVSSIEQLKRDLSKVPFYMRYQNASFPYDYPVMTKSFIQEHMSDFVNPSYARKDLVTVTTSGSYGSPTSFYITKDKKDWQHAEVIHFGMPVGYDIGVEHMYIRSVVSKGRLTQLLQNEHYLGCKYMDDAFLRHALQILLKKKTKVIIGFPSAIAAIAEFCISNNYKPRDFAVEGVITSSENLTTTQRYVMKQAWACNICSRYSTEEFGVIANQYEAEGPFQINSLNYIVEIMDLDKDQPVEPGNIGRVVVTDLHSNAMPLVRYDTGDIALLQEYNNDNLGYLRSFHALSGRGIQIITTPNNEKRFPMFFDSIMENYPEVSQYQFIQETHCDYTCVVVAKTVMEQARCEMLLSALNDWIGKGANIKIIQADEIERLGSGKRPYVINRTLKR